MSQIATFDSYTKVTICSYTAVPVHCSYITDARAPSTEGLVSLQYGRFLLLHWQIKSLQIAYFYSYTTATLLQLHCNGCTLQLHLQIQALHLLKVLYLCFLDILLAIRSRQLLGIILRHPPCPEAHITVYIYTIQRVWPRQEEQTIKTFRTILMFKNAPKEHTHRTTAQKPVATETKTWRVHQRHWSVACSPPTQTP